jgi:hypothetical protein
MLEIQSGYVGKNRLIKITVISVRGLLIRFMWKLPFGLSLRERPHITLFSAVYISFMRKKKAPIPKKSTTVRDRNMSLRSPGKQHSDAIEPTDQDVAKKAYFMYLDQGSPGGLDVHHWLLAQAEVEAYQIGRIATVSTTVAKAVANMGQAKLVSSNGKTVACKA